MMSWVKKRHHNDQWSDAKYCPTKIDVDVIRDKMEEGDEILVIPDDVWSKKYNDLTSFESVRKGN